jgi:hypothetical protein
VPADGSAGYISLIRGARGVVLERTGHLGWITRPAAFAAIVRDFAAAFSDHAGAERILPDPPHRRVQNDPAYHPGVA